METVKYKDNYYKFIKTDYDTCTHCDFWESRCVTYADCNGGYYKKINISEIRKLKIENILK